MQAPGEASPTYREWKGKEGSEMSQVHFWYFQPSISVHALGQPFFLINLGSNLTTYLDFLSFPFLCKATDVSNFVH